MTKRIHLVLTAAIAGALGGGVLLGRALDHAPAAPAATPAPTPAPGAGASQIVTSSGASQQPGDTFAATTKRLAALGKPSTRQFDLLSGVIEPGAKIETSASLSWADPHDCTWIVAPEILPLFGNVQLTAGKATTASGTNTGKTHARFAAVVTCETAETTPQAQRDFQAAWPPLVGAALDADLAKPAHELTAEERAILGAVPSSGSGTPSPRPVTPNRPRAKKAPSP